MGTRAAMFVVLALAVFCTGCPVAVPIDLTGRWEGTIAGQTDGVDLSGTLTGDIVQDGSTISGVWSSRFPNSRYNNGGSLVGTVSGSSITATFAPSNARSCSFVAVSTFTRDTIQGSYSAADCSVTHIGVVELHRVDVGADARDGG